MGWAAARGGGTGPGVSNSGSSGGGTNVRQLGFDVRASLKFSKTSVNYEVNVDSVTILVANHQLVPKLILTYNIDSKYANMLELPYEVTLSIKEKNTTDDPRSSLFETKWINTTFDTPHLRREAALRNRPDVMTITHKFVLKDAYTMVNTGVGGVFKYNYTVKKVLQQLWNSTKHGTLQLQMCEPDNKKTYQQIGISNLKFHQSINYISQKFGIYDNLPILYSDWNKTYISSVNKSISKYKPITIEILSGDSNRSGLNVDSRLYTLPELPQINSNFHNISSVFPKKMDVIQHVKDDLYKKEKVDIIGITKAMKHVNSTDVLDKFLEKNVNPKTYFVTPNNNIESLKESISLMTGNTVEPLTIVIEHPFRFDHWKLGTKVLIEPKHNMYQGMNLSFYINEYVLKIYKDSGKAWTGEVHLTLNTASTRDIYIW